MLLYYLISALTGHMSDNTMVYLVGCCHIHCVLHVKLMLLSGLYSTECTQIYTNGDSDIFNVRPLLVTGQALEVVKYSRL